MSVFECCNGCDDFKCIRGNPEVKAQTNPSPYEIFQQTNVQHRKRKNSVKDTTPSVAVRRGDHIKISIRQSLNSMGKGKKR